MLKVVVLCGRESRHLHVANRLCRAADVVAVVQEQRPWSWQRLRRALHPARLARKLHWRLSSGGRDPVEARFFFGDRAPALDRPELCVRVPHINHPAVAALLEREQPDVVAVFGVPRLCPPLLGHGRLGMINLHTGLAPGYRGVDSAFWALLAGRPEHVGGTLHFIEEGLDTGAMLAHVYPGVGPEDDHRTLYWKTIRACAEAYAELLPRLERGERFGRPQTGPGHLYRARDRTPAREQELRAKLAGGFLAGRSIPPGISWFQREDGAPAAGRSATAAVSDPAHQEHHHDHDQEHRQHTGRRVAPLAAVRPGRQGSEEQQDQDD
jgi:methionyl-tRNA formyltransferase